MGEILMSNKEWSRKRVLKGVQEGKLTLEKASTLLNLSYRQTRRINRKYRENGDLGLISK